MIRALISLVVLFIVFVFLVNNKDAVISIQYFPGGSAKMIPLYLFVLGTFLLGFVLSVVMMIPSWLRLKLETRRQRKEIESLSEEIGHLRILSPSTSSSTPSALEKDSPEH
ncbi:MAG: LapA family protein [Nitrospirae bacterium]|nr:LapA family protein [Nitrospirota bacterium]